MPARVAPQERAPEAAYGARREAEGLPGPFQAGRRSERSRTLQAHSGDHHWSGARWQCTDAIARPGAVAARSRPIKEEG